jgi:large subunit ribosomal protein L29
MKYKEITEYSDKQIKETIADERQNLTKLRMAHGVSPLENSSRIVKTKRLIARLLTEQRIRAIKSANAQTK